MPACDNAVQGFGSRLLCFLIDWKSERQGMGRILKQMNKNLKGWESQLRRASSEVAGMSLARWPSSLV